MNPGVVEEGVKAAGGVATGIVDSMRSQPLAIAMVLMNLALLTFLFYYLSRITARTETTVASLFQAQDKLYAQWAIIVKDTNELTEKTMHCVLPEDVLKLLQIPIRPGQPVPMPRGPAPLEPLDPLRPQNNRSPLLDLTLPRLEKTGD
jgi:hypothetical protein